MRHGFRILIFATFLLDPAGVAVAGMPMALLTDLARMRVQTISFFLVGFLLCSWVVGKIWNAARRDFPRLPYLTYSRATGLVTLWGLLFVLVLTMISGARELMTPGAWKKQGFTYKLADEVPTAATATAVPHEAERLQTLDRLRVALWTYARHHGGSFPPSSPPPEIPEDLWRLPDPSGMRYLYRPGQVADRGASLLAYEPNLFGKDRFALLTSGQILRMTEEQFRKTSAEEGPR